MLTDVQKFPIPIVPQSPAAGVGGESYAGGLKPANDALVHHLADLLTAGAGMLGAVSGAVYVRVAGERYHLAASFGIADDDLQRRRRLGPLGPPVNAAARPEVQHAAIETLTDRAWGVVELVFPLGESPTMLQRRAWESLVRHAGWTVDRHRRATLWDELAGEDADGDGDLSIGDTRAADAAVHGWQAELPFDDASHGEAIGQPNGQANDQAYDHGGDARDARDARDAPASDRERPRVIVRDGVPPDRRRPEARARQLERAAASLGRARQVHEVARELVEQVSARLAVAGAVVLQLTPGGRDLVPLASRGAASALLGGGRAVPLDATLAVAEAARTGRAVLRDGEMRGRARVVALPLRTADGEPAVLGVVLADAHELDAADRELLRALARVGGQAMERARLHEAAHAASQAKSDFLAMMSHELRTPLNAIIGYSGLIAEQVVGPVNGTQQEQLRRVQEHARHLLTLIEEMLTISQAESGRERVREERVNPGALLHEVVALLAPAAARKGLAVQVVVEPDVRPAVTDGDKVRQVLAHLLTNAIKFTGAGEVEARVQEDRAGDQRMLHFEVSDTGVGIAPQDIERIFEPFWQADQSRAHRVAGTGLGLNVTRRLAYLLGGEVLVTSAPGHGSTFVLRVPVKQ